ncbi:hypothetical protein F5984_00750 [Rudanella paleaurantiibacter]|uniref:DUF1080 domain-containing protein n=1 Tax=Rudanella paleaurantiibacter TaxID=2614655 RepID=A0A7J5U3W0_9BACT|nr:hypothetical protein [Rudanella paleaurantiibacter]KAB7732524.1 hypothetical protein F5984_00750 [Rudanella paleaurantiibacter]
MIRLLFILLIWLPELTLAQSKTVESASSAWVAVETSPMPTWRSPEGLVFRETFAEANANRWPVGLRAGFTYTPGPVGYQLERRGADSSQLARAWIQLANRFDLPRIDTFMVQLDVLPRADMYPDGGLLFGVADSLNYSRVWLNGRDRVIVQQIVDGKPDLTSTNDRLASVRFPTQKGRNRITVWRRGARLHVFVNDKELPGSPFLNRAVRGNGVGVFAKGNWLAFRNLTVRTP